MPLSLFSTGPKSPGVKLSMLSKENFKKSTPKHEPMCLYRRTYHMRVYILTKWIIMKRKSIQKKLTKILRPADLLVGRAKLLGNLKSTLICKIGSEGFHMILRYNFQFTSLSSVFTYYLPFSPSTLFDPQHSHQHGDSQELP